MRREDVGVPDGGFGRPEPAHGDPDQVHPAGVDGVVVLHGPLDLQQVQLPVVLVLHVTAAQRVHPDFARGLAAVAASARGDTEAVLAGAGQAVALLDDEVCEPLDVVRGGWCAPPPTTA